MRKRSEVSERLFYLLTGTACLIIVLMIALILGNISIHGRSRLSWEFLTASPEQGMTAGGIFPAIYGTVLLLFLMTVAVVPLCVVGAIYLNGDISQASFGF